MKVRFLAACSLMVLGIGGCSDSGGSAQQQANAAAAALQSNVERPIALKDLVIGANIKLFKGAKKLTSSAYMFDYPYFGEPRPFMATVNDGGQVYEYKTTMGGSFENLRTGLEDKLTADNSKRVSFDCSTRKFKPDSNAEIHTKTCKVSGPAETLTIEEMRMQPTARTELPTVVVSLKLVGTAIAAQAKDAEDKLLLDNARTREAKQKSDL